jgi:hypothetical protein
LWYPIDKDGVVDYSRPIVPEESRLPIDPSTDVPDGYLADQRGRPDGFAGDPRHHGHLGDVIDVAANRVPLARRS